MVSLPEEAAKALYRVRDSYRALREKDPNNELLGLARINSNQTIIRFEKECYRMFARPKEANYIGYNRYADAMEAA